MQLSQFETRHNNGDVIVKISMRFLMVENSWNLSFISPFDMSYTTINWRKQCQVETQL